MKSNIINYIEKLTKSLNSISIKEIEKVAEVLLDAYENEKKIFICGNGGSASTASHFACDLNKGVRVNHDKKFKIISLCDNIPIITAYSNDLSYEDIFLEQLKNFYQKGDIIIGISGSGNSENVLKALDFVNSNNGISIGFTGFNGGKLKQITHYSINSNTDDMQISEDIHLILTHIFMKLFNSKFRS